MFTAPAHSGGVDEQELATSALIKNIDRVARRSWQFADNRALALHDRIDQRPFSDVWPADDGNANWLRVLIKERRLPGPRARSRRFGKRRSLRQKLFDLIEQIRNAAIMFGADRDDFFKA